MKTLKKYIKKLAPDFIMPVLEKIYSLIFWYPKKILNQKTWEKNSAFFDRVIEKYSKKHSDFYFIEIGANDGKSNDLVYSKISKFGWKGVFVEPQSIPFAKLKKNYQKYKGVQLENSAIYKTNCKKRIYFPSEDKERQVASLIKDKFPKHASFEIVNCITLKDLIKKYHISKINLLQIDVEGLDFEIIKIIPFNIIIPDIIRYEHIHLSHKDKKDCQKFLEDKKYTVYEQDRDTFAILTKLLDKN